LTLSSLGRAWRFNRRLVVLCALAGACLGILFSKVIGESYASSATVILSATNYDEQFGPIGTLSAFEFDQAMSTKLALARSPSVRDAAARALGHEPAPTVVEREPTTQLIRFTSAGSTPDEAVASANAMASAFVKDEVGRTRRAAERAVDQMSDAIDETRRRFRTVSTSTTFGLAERAALSQRLSDQLARLDTANRGLRDAALAAVVNSRATIGEPAGRFSPSVMAVLGLLLGGLMGLVVAAIREQATDVPREPSDIAAAFPSVPVVGSLSHDARRGLLGFGGAKRRPRSAPVVDLTAGQIARATVDRNRGDDATLVLVVSAMGESDTTSATHELSRAFAETEQPTVAVIRKGLTAADPVVVPDQVAGRPRWGPPVVNGGSGRMDNPGGTPASRSGNGPSRRHAPSPSQQTSASSTHRNLAIVEAEPLLDVANPGAIVERSLLSVRPRGRWVVFEGPAVLTSPVYQPALSASDAIVLVVSAERTTWQMLTQAVAAITESTTELVAIVQA
jgi:hypothetical protein